MRGLPIVTLAAVVLAAAGDGAANAADPGDLYAGRALVTGQGEEGRPGAFAAALEQALVRVSGDPRLAGDPRVATLAAGAAALVEDYSYRDRMAGIPVHDEQGTRDRPYEVTVRFDPARIDEALRALGRQPWPAPRPSLMLIVDVQAGDVAYRLTRDGERGRDLREAVADAAWRYGMAVDLPDAATAAAMGAEATAAGGVGADFLLSGDLSWSDGDLGWTAGWTLAAPDGRVAWQVAGVSFDAAFRSAVGGAAQVLSGNGRPN